MVIERIDGLIADAMRDKNQVRLDTLRNIKSELLKAQKSGGKYDTQVENGLLLKMVAKSEDAINQFKAGGRDDLANEEEGQLSIIREFAPKTFSDDEIEHVTKRVLKSYILSKDDGFKVSMKDTKPVLEVVKGTCPNANGKHVSTVIKAVMDGGLEL